MGSRDPLRDAYVEDRTKVDITKLRVKGMIKTARLTLRVIGGHDWRRKVDKTVADINVNLILDAALKKLDTKVSDLFGSSFMGTGIPKRSVTNTQLKVYPLAYHCSGVRIDDLYTEVAAPFGGSVWQVVRKCSFEYSKHRGPARILVRDSYDFQSPPVLKKTGDWEEATEWPDADPGF